MEMISQLIIHCFSLLRLALLIWIVLSWIPDFQNNAFYYELNKFFGKLLKPIREVIPPIGGFLDISPIILGIGLQLLEGVILLIL